MTHRNFGIVRHEYPMDADRLPRWFNPAEPTERLYVLSDEDARALIKTAFPGSRLPSRPRKTRRQPTAYYVAIGLLLGILFGLGALYIALDQFERTLPGASLPPAHPAAVNEERFA